MDETPKWTSVAFPREMVKVVRELIEELKYWPSSSAFCREAVLEKIRKEKKILEELREAKGEEGE